MSGVCRYNYYGDDEMEYYDYFGIYNDDNYYDYTVGCILG
jgi:hypothetical protein